MEMIQVVHRCSDEWPNPPRATLGLTPWSSADAGRTVPRSVGYQAASIIIPSAPPISLPDPKACLFVLNLAWRTTESELEQHLQSAFVSVAAVKSVFILRHADGRSRGMAKVVMRAPIDASSAIASLDGQPLDGRPLKIALDRFHPSTHTRSM